MARTTCPTQSTPARVEKANWKGEHAASTSSPNCLARVLATNRRNTVPVAMPRTPPSRFSRAVMAAVMNARKTSTGTVPRAKSSAAFVRSNNVSLSSKHTRRISLEHPPGPGALPEGALRKHSANRLESNCNSLSDKFCLASASTQHHAWRCTCVPVLLRLRAYHGLYPPRQRRKGGDLPPLPSLPFRRASLPGHTASREGPSRKTAEAPPAALPTRPPWPPPQSPSEAAAQGSPWHNKTTLARGPPGHTKRPPWAIHL